MKKIYECIGFLQKAKKLKPEYDAGIDNDIVNHPKHYEAAAVNARFEPIDLARWYSFAIGNAIKYILRAPYKEHEKLDLEKARFYLNDWLDFTSRDCECKELSSARHVQDKSALLVSIICFKAANKYLALLFDENAEITTKSVKACLEAVDSKIKELEHK